MAPMMTCPKCGKKMNAAPGSTCPNCGYEVPRKGKAPAKKSPAKGKAPAKKSTRPY